MNGTKLRKGVGALALATAATLAATTMPAGAYGHVDTEDGLTDFQPDTAEPTDGGWARLIALPLGDSTRFILIVGGLDGDAAGTTLGAHIHVGPCVEGNGPAAGPHYNTSGETTPADTDHEVWLDFTIRSSGYGVSRATVPFVIESGDAQSLVIHAMQTQEGTGVAGARWACIPVEF